MKNIIFNILIIIVLNDNIHTYEPITKLWVKVQTYIKEGKMVVENKTHFIFDELNVTQYQLNSTEMKYLYQKQEELYHNQGISTFIFIIYNLEDNLSTLQSFLIIDIIMTYKVGIIDSIIAIYIIESETLELYIRPYIDNKITKNNQNNIKNNLQTNLKNEKYYKGLVKYIEEIDYYVGKKDAESLSDEEKKAFLIGFSIVFSILVIAFLAVCMIRKNNFFGNDTHIEDGLIN